MDWQTVISVVGVLIPGIALYATYQVAFKDRLNSNNWSIYEAYNQERIRSGRAVARDVLKTRPTGFADFKEYKQFFWESHGTAEEVRKLQEQEQSLHDLMAFYHQVGLLLDIRQV